MSSVGEELPKLMAKVRDVILPIYDEIPEGRFAAQLIRQDLDRAAEALASGDVIEILQAYQALKDIKL